ncbi:MAG: hypothetical protein K8953_01670 [Proteobacteria bacterium]|nr:hypothetical protein [Pseudomonadota bacterium]
MTQESKYPATTEEIKFCKKTIEILNHMFLNQYKLEKEFWLAILIGEQVRQKEPNNKHSQMYRFMRSREKYYNDKDFCCDECGNKKSCQNKKPYADRVKKTMLDLALRSDFTDGFDILERNDCLYLSFEATVIRNPDDFDKQDIETVKKKMCDAGYPDDFWVMPSVISY